MSCGMRARQSPCWYYFVRCYELNNDEANGENKVKNYLYFVLMDVVAHMWLASKRYCVISHLCTLYMTLGKKSSCMVDHASNPRHVVITHVHNIELGTTIKQMDHYWEMVNYRLDAMNCLVVPQTPSLGLSFIFEIFELIPRFLGTPRVGSSATWLPLMTWNHEIFMKLVFPAQGLGIFFLKPWLWKGSPTECLQH